MKFDLLFSSYGLTSAFKSPFQFGVGEDKNHFVWTQNQPYNWSSEAERQGAFISANAFDIVRDVEFSIIGQEKMVNGILLRLNEFGFIEEVH